MSKIKIFNDPVHGFIRIPRDIIFQLVEHPWFQRLRRIKQLGLTHLVYPGALHTRFHHALGALHLMNMALDTLKTKGVALPDEDCENASIAVLLHDIGHGPFSHALEYSLVDCHHEELSLLFMERLNEQFNGKLQPAIDIYIGNHPKLFLHELVSSQLDVDRLDYLRRDSFYTGVSEGVVGTDRIIGMMEVINNELVIEEKGIYSIEKFLLARRLMYWQVYLHKTVVVAEQLLIRILDRAKFLARNGHELFCTPSLRFFLYEQISVADFKANCEVLGNFAKLDDYDLMASVKVWAENNDKILSVLCSKLINRELLRIEFLGEPATAEKLGIIGKKAAEKFGLTEEEASYLVFAGEVENSTYTAESINIKIGLKNGEIKDIAEVSDQYNLGTLTRKVTKYFICYPKEISVNA